MSLILKLTMVIILLLTGAMPVFACAINTRTYVLVSFSMNDQSIKSYFAESKQYGATLVFRGLINDGEKGNFLLTKKKFEALEIDADINPVIFEELAIEQVPAVIVVHKNGKTKKLTGHIPLKTALEKMGELERKP